MLAKLQNIQKTIEDCLKSHFSHVRNEVGKTILKPPILERFLERISVQDWKKIVQKSLSEIIWFLIRFLINFGWILDPLGDFWEPQGIVNEPCFAVLHDPQNQKSSKTLRDTPEPPFSIIFIEFVNGIRLGFSYNEIHPKLLENNPL